MEDYIFDDAENGFTLSRSAPFLPRMLAEDSSCDAPVVLNPILTYILVVWLVLMSGLFSGLTLGLLGLDKVGLDIVAHGDDKKTANYARRIIPIREDGNLLLCALLLGNVAVNSFLSILLGSIAGGMEGFVISTIVIVIFGEILPQASCARYALRIGSLAVPVVRVIQIILFVAAKPLALALDCLLGDDVGTIHNRTELMRMLQIHIREGALERQEGDILAGALKFREIPISKVMTAVHHAFMLSKGDQLDYGTVSEIFRSGFSRIPIYGHSRNDIVGVLVTKDLIFVDPEDAVPIEQFLKVFGRQLEAFTPDTTCGEALTRFKRGRAHMGIIREANTENPNKDPFMELKGIITLEDIIEEIIQDEIVDETDVYVDIQQRTQVGDILSPSGALETNPEGTIWESADSSPGAKVFGGLGGARTSSSSSGPPPTFSDKDSRGNLREFHRLRFFNPEIVDEKLTAEEVEVLISHLLSDFYGPGLNEANSPRKKGWNEGSGSDGRGWIGRKALQWLFVEKIQVRTIHRKSEKRCPVPHLDDWLYKRGQKSDRMTVVLTGSVMLTVGRDGFQKESGTFTVLAVDALGASKDYAPDFSASVWSDTVRVVELRRADYEQAKKLEKSGSIPLIQPTVSRRMEKVAHVRKMRTAFQVGQEEDGNVMKLPPPGEGKKSERYRRGAGDDDDDFEALYSGSRRKKKRKSQKDNKDKRTDKRTSSGEDGSNKKASPRKWFGMFSMGGGGTGESRRRNTETEDEQDADERSYFGSEVESGASPIRAGQKIGVGGSGTSSAGSSQMSSTTSDASSSSSKQDDHRRVMDNRNDHPTTPGTPGTLNDNKKNHAAFGAFVQINKVPPSNRRR